MTKRDKTVLLSSVLLAAAVTVTAVIPLISSSEPSGVTTGYPFFAGGIVLIAVLSVVAVYFSKVRKGQFEKKLDDAYFQEYQIIRDAVMNSQLSSVSKKEIREDVLDILLSAQKAGKPVKDVVGDPVIFSREIIGSFTKPTRVAILSLIDGIVAFSLFVLGVNTFLWLEQIDAGFFGIGIDISMVLFFVIVAFAIIPLTKNLIAKQSSLMFLLPLGAGIAFVITAELLRKYFYHIDAVRTVLDGTVVLIPNLTVFMIYVLLIPVLRQIKIQIRRYKI